MLLEELKYYALNEIGVDLDELSTAEKQTCRESFDRARNAETGYYNFIISWQLYFLFQYVSILHWIFYIYESFT